MKVFLLEYDRSLGRLVRLEDFGEDRERAAAARLEAELAAMAGLDREIVTLEAESLDVLRRTHGSYFNKPDELRANFPEGTEAA